MQSIRIVDFPECKAVSSGTGMFGEQKFTRFADWFSSLPRTVYPRDYLYHNGEGFCWLYLYEDGMDVPDEFDIVDFKGGLYSVATDIDQMTDMEAMKNEVDGFLAENGFERDGGRYEMGNIITSPYTYKTLGYHQMDYYAPIKPKACERS